MSEFEATVGNINITAKYDGDDGRRSWRIEHGSDFYHYASLKGINNQSDFIKEDVERTDLINFSSEKTRYTAQFCFYSADVDIFEEDIFEKDTLDGAFMRSAPDYGNELASEEFTQGWNIITDKQNEVLGKFAADPDYIKAVNKIKEQLEKDGIDPDNFFDKSSNKLIKEDSLKGNDRMMGSSVYWTKAIEGLNTHLMHPESVPPSPAAEVNGPTAPNNSPATEILMRP